MLWVPHAKGVDRATIPQTRVVVELVRVRFEGRGDADQIDYSVRCALFGIDEWVGRGSLESGRDWEDEAEQVLARFLAQHLAAGSQALSNLLESK